MVQVDPVPEDTGADVLPDVEPGEIGEITDDDVECREQTVPESWHAQRIDKFLVRMAPEFSRSHLQSLIERGCVRVNRAVVDTASRKLQGGQVVQVRLLPTDESRAFRPESMALDIVFEDEHLLVLNKPAGLVVHPAPGNWSGTLMNGLLAHHAGASQLPRAGIVHRLDKDTSGLMVVGKTLQAVTALVRMIAAREVHREYLALAHGRVPDFVQVDAALGRDPQSRVRMAIVPSGKPARTDVHGLATSAGVSLVHCVLHTGRTHQIRVHLMSRGHPLLSDPVYGGAPGLGLTRQALHAARLSFTHPVTRDALVFRAPLPQDLRLALRTAGLPESPL